MHAGLLFFPALGAGLHERGADMGVVSLQGRITVSNANEMRRTLADALRSQPSELTVDLLSVTYMDTSGLATLRGLTVSYGNQRVLDGVNLDVQRGEVMVLLGGSGSGKSTMLRHIIGLERPDSGTVLVQGVDINRCTARELKAIRRGMGVAFHCSIKWQQQCSRPVRSERRFVGSFEVRGMLW
jgi:anti-anti-sigma factor